MFDGFTLFEECAGTGLLSWELHEWDCMNDQVKRGAVDWLIFLENDCTASKLELRLRHRMDSDKNPFGGFHLDHIGIIL